MRIKLRDKYILVFGVVNKKMYKGLITPQVTSYADYYETIGVWIAELGPNCRCVEEGVGLGSKCYVLDMYDLDSDLPMAVAKTYGSRVNFSKEILQEAKDYDGIVKAFIVHENALIAVKEDTCQKTPLLKWDWS